MFYPQGNFHSQGSVGYPQGLAYPQGFGYPQSFGYPQGGFGPQGIQGTSNAIPFANTLYGYPQPTAGFQSFAQGLPQMSNWQHPAQQQAQQQAALQQQAMLQLLATQLGQSFTPQHLQGTHPFQGLANGAANPEINPAPLQQSQQQLLQRLAQYHHLVAQQLAQLAGQQATPGNGSPYTGQFIPNQFVSSSGQYIPNQAGANFVPGITMH